MHARSRVSFRHLRLFDAVGRLGSVARAAAENGISQPAATQALAAMQAKVAVPLLKGGGRGTTLTPVGQTLHARLALILRKLGRALAEVGMADPDEVMRQLSHDQVRALRMVHEYGSVEIACLALEVSPHSPQRPLRRLAELMDVALLQRTGAGRTLTTSGRLLAQSVSLVSDEIDQLLRSIRENVARRGTRILLGVSPDPGTAAVGNAARAHSIRHPNCCIELVEADQRDLRTRLAIGEIDLLVGHVLEEAGSDLVWQAMANTRFRIACRHEHPLLGRQAVKHADLLKATWVLGARGSRRRYASTLLFGPGEEPRCSLVTSAAPLLAQVLAASDQLGLMTEHELAARAQQVTVLPYPMPDVVATVGWARRADWLPGAMHQELLDHIGQGFNGPRI